MFLLRTIQVIQYTVLYILREENAWYAWSIKSKLRQVFSGKTFLRKERLSLEFSLFLRNQGQFYAKVWGEPYFAGLVL